MAATPASLAAAPRAVPRFTVSLDDEPRRRWMGVVARYRERWPELVRDMWAAFADLKGEEGENRAFARALSESVLDGLRGAGRSEYVEELRAIAEGCGVELADLVLLHLSYESHSACTAALATADDGAVFLARTLDWDMPKLQELTIDVDFVRGGRIVYTATTWAGYIGVLTAQRAGRYAVAVNYRDEDEEEAAEAESAAGCGPRGGRRGSKGDRRSAKHRKRANQGAAAAAAAAAAEEEEEEEEEAEDSEGGEEEEKREEEEDEDEAADAREWRRHRDSVESHGGDASPGPPADRKHAGARARHFAWPVGLFLRHALDDPQAGATYASLLAAVASAPLMSPAYFILAGVLREGAIVTRGVSDEPQRKELSRDERRRQVDVQANMDHWVRSKQRDMRDSLRRVAVARRLLAAAPKIDAATLWSVVFADPIWDCDSIYGNVLCPARGVYETRLSPPASPPSSKGRKRVGGGRRK
jgi:hypothetical protein